MAAISLAVAAVALLGAVVTKVATGGLRDCGLAERLTIYPVYGWVALMGLVFILLSARNRPCPAWIRQDRRLRPQNERDQRRCRPSAEWAPTLFREVGAWILAVRSPAAICAHPTATLSLGPPRT